MVILAEITKIYMYPIKSIGRMELSHATVTQFGLAHPENLEIVDR